MQHTDVVVIGGGIVGLATAWQVTEKFPGKRVVVLEKESELGFHQTGHNSGVLHSGIYYRPDTLRARNCRDGRLAMIEFCEREDVPFDICGKVIVAVDETELPTLIRIHERGQANDIDCELIDRARLTELEPHAAGIQAIHVPQAGILDFRQVCIKLAAILEQRNASIHLGTRVTSLRSDGDATVICGPNTEVRSSYVINCTGLQSDRTTRLAGCRPPARIVPFRGEYFELTPDAAHFCRNLIYPVPDPRFPFLGVHFTRMIQGGVECGPNAVLSLAREGYRKTDINLRDLAASLMWPGFLRLASRHWRMGLGEMWRSVSKRAFVRALQRLMPEIRSEHLEPAPAGIRAQALARNGDLVDDFLIVEGERIINVCNAPSPAATASLNIGRLIVEKLPF